MEMIIRIGDLEAEEMQNMRGGAGSAVRFLYENAAGLGGKIKMFAVMDLEAGATVGEHKHEGDMEIYLLLDGTAKALDNGEEVTLGPGDMLITKDGESHSLANQSADRLSFVAVVMEQ